MSAVPLCGPHLFFIHLFVRILPRFSCLGWPRWLVTSDGKVKDIGIANQWNYKRFLYGTCVGDVAHHGGYYRASNDGHDQQRRSELGVYTKILHTKREDSGKHDGIKEAEQHNGPDGGCSRSRDSRQSTQEREGCEESQQPGRSDSFHHCRPSK